ncbi:MAG TPA: hypothetical protein VF715_06295 [Thermoleophilaceae bacterium]|jgi:hypothetical protein
MRITALRELVNEAALDFAWDQWAQLGVLASPRRPAPWSMDPEALLVFSLEVARRDPRLFEEVLDWLLVNERMVSVQRLRNIARAPGEDALARAALAWVAERKPRARRDPDASVPSTDAEPALLFHGLSSRDAPLDPAFLRHGFAKPVTPPSRRSQTPDPRAPIALAFRLRHLLGVSARAEVLRTLLTIGVPRVSIQAIARGAGFSKRNVQEALNSLVAAGVVQGISVAGAQSYSIDREPWAPLFGVTDDRWPVHVDWPQLLHAFVEVIRWLNDPATDGLSDYMRFSEARTLLDRVADDLRYAGVVVEMPQRGALEEGWSAFEATVHNTLAMLGVSRAA